MTMAAIENEIRSNILSNNNFGVLKFVDIGKGNGKLGDGVLQAEQLDKFLQELTEATTFLDNIKMHASDNDKLVLDTMGFDVELEAGRINGTPQTLTNSQDPNFLHRAFDAEELRALTGIHRTALRENIEQKGFMNTLAGKFGEACGRALERVLIYGDKDTTQTNISSGYKVVDGICKKIEKEGENEVEGIDLTATDSNSLNEVRRLIDGLPDKYVEEGKLKLFAPEALKRDLLRYIADNKQGDASITYIKERNEMSVEGIPLISVPAFSNPRNGFGKPIILTHEENIQWLVNNEKVIVEDDFVLRSNTWDIASTVYADIDFAFPDASIMGYLTENVKKSTVKVHAVDKDGDDVSGAAITLAFGDSTFTGTTGTAGGCSISNVPYGTYTVTATKTGYANYSGTVTVSRKNTDLPITLTSS